jgi:hypothetical protein
MQFSVVQFHLLVKPQPYLSFNRTVQVDFAAVAGPGSHAPDHDLRQDAHLL